jgi:hypothetical protein
MSNIERFRSSMVMSRIAILTVTLAMTLDAVALAQQLPPQPPPVASPFGLGQGDERERAACHPDVVTYCQPQLDANPDDVLGILSCLQSNRAKISTAC